VLFEWTYTSPEAYCLDHLLESVDTQPGMSLLDYMPDSQQITWRPAPDLPVIRLTSTSMLQSILTEATP
jgi:hypothetical protein